MKPVYLWAWKRIRLDNSRDVALMAQPLLRRMTPLQKAVLVCLHHLMQEFPEAHQLACESEAALFLANAYGEVGSMLRITQSILAHDLPISPKDFQHSVLNAALSYLAISQNWHQGAYALSGGFASPDSALHLAAQRIKFELDQACLVVHAHEPYAEPYEAEAEMMVLSHSSPPRSGFRLERMERLRVDAQQDESLRCYREGDRDEPVPWLVEDDGPVLRRCVSPQREQGWVTVWTKS